MLKGEKFTNDQYVDGKEINHSVKASEAISPDAESLREIMRNLEKKRLEMEMQKTELSRIRQEFQRFRDKYSLVYDLSPFGCISLSSSGDIIESNHQFTQIIGYPKIELTGSNFLNYIDNESQDIFLSHLKAIFETKTKQTCSVNIVKKDLSIIPVELESSAINGHDGNHCQCFTIIKSPINQTAANGFSASDSKIIELSYDAIIMTDKNLNIVHWNKAAETIFGWQSREAKDKITSQLVRSKVLSFLTDNAVTKNLTENSVWNGEAICLKKDGTKINMLTSAGVIWDDEGQFNGVLIIYHETVSDTSAEEQVVNNRIETLVKEHTKELTTANLILQQEIEKHKLAELTARESEGKNRDLVDNIKLGIFRCTPGAKGKFLEVNRAMEDITGYTRKELLQLDVCDLFANPEDKELHSTDVAVSKWKSTRELALRRKDEKELIIAETIVAIRYDSGRILFYDGILEDITERKQAQIKVDQSLLQLQKTIKEIIEAMAYIGEVRDPYTAGHQRRVAQLSSEIARQMGLKNDQYEGLSMAAFVHDIGKILVPADILSKPGKLTKPEFDMLKDHTRIGYEILKTIEFPYPIANIVLQHHERLDGSGYPNGLKSKEIKIEAKILAVADVVEAMSSHRPYRPALGIEAALDEIKTHRGTLYEPAAVDACINLFEEKAFSLN